MYPIIDKKKTGIRLRRLMDECGFTVKDIQQYLGLASIQSIYHWLNGISLPTIDHLYALSELFRLPVDDMLCGNRRTNYILDDRKRSQYRRLRVYYDKLNEYLSA